MKSSRASNRTERFRRARSRRSRRPLAVVGLVAFLALDAVLVAWATGTGPVDALGNDQSSPGASGTKSSSPQPTTTPQGNVPAAAPSAPVRQVSAATPAIAWTAAVSTCAASDTTPASVEVTTDGGATWTSHVVPGVASVDQLIATSGTEITVVGRSTTTCAPTVAVSYSGGAEFADRASALPSTWYVDPTDSSLVHGPAGLSVSPCAQVLDVAVASQMTAAVRCDDGSLIVSTDGGATWAASSTYTDVLAIDLTSATAAVRSGSDSCKGVQTGPLTMLLDGTGGTCSPLSDRWAVVAARSDGSLWTGAPDTSGRPTNNLGAEG